MEERKNDEILYKISPNFNIIYELFMPTGRKIKSTITILIIMCIISIIFFCNIGNITGGDIILLGDMSISKLLSIICITVDIFLVLKLIVHIVFQVIQYNHITYTFYKTHMTYEDDFLNQHRKNIEYSNIKEVEIRRTIIDRILGYGVIIIYTNAENSRNNGLVIYSIRNPKNAYDIIDSIIHKTKEEKTQVNIEVEKSNDLQESAKDIGKEADVKNIEEENMSDEQYSSESERQKRVEENKKDEEQFLESLKNVNDENQN